MRSIFYRSVLSAETNPFWFYQHGCWLGQFSPSVFLRSHQDCCRSLVRTMLMPSNVSNSSFISFSATALQSLEIACDTILSGQAKIMIAGGFDDFSETGSFEFANMGATSNSRTEFAMGREPNEMSHPTASTRDGVSFHTQPQKSRH